MRLCYNLQTCMDSAIETDLLLCKEAGFDEFEISFAKAMRYLESHTMEELGMLVKNSGLKCAAVNAIFSISFCSPEKWERVKSEFEFACEIGRMVGADKTIVLTDERNKIPKDISENDIFEDTADVLSKLADIGEKHAMTVALEPVGDMAVGDAKTAYRIIEKINRENVKIVIDDFNLYLWEPCTDYSEFECIDPNKIAIVHINDAENIPYALIDQMHRCMPCDGRINVRAYMDKLKSIGYDGSVSVEVLNPSIWAKGPEIVIPEAYKKMKEFL